MMDIAEISAAPHFPRPLKHVLVRSQQTAVSELLSALCGSQDFVLCELNGELHLVSAVYPGE